MIQRRPATSSDEDFARAAEYTAYHDVIVRQFGSWDQDLNEKHWKANWNPARYEVILSKGQRTGYIVVEKHPDHLFISEIVVIPEYQNQGIGSQILNEELDRARSAGLPVRLQFLKENRAVTLYLRLGFKKYSETETHTLMQWEG